MVQLDELARLLLGVADEPVGLGDHLVLADHPHHRLGLVAVGERGVLDAGQRVGGVDEGHAPAVAGEPAHLAGEPVVRVDDVVVAGLVPGLGPQDPAVNAQSWLGRSFLPRPSNGPAATCRTSTPGASAATGGCSDDGGAGEDLDRDAAAGHPGGRLHDVDVHAARVAGARLLQRRGVHGKHADPARDVCDAAVRRRSRRPV